MLFNHSVHWQCLILAGSNLPLGDKAGAAFFQSYFLLKQMLFLISVSKMVGILPDGTLRWCHGEYEWYFMHEPRGSWHNKYLIFIFQMNFYWIFKVLKYLLLLDCISWFLSPTCFDFKSLYRAKLNTSFVFIPLHSDIVFSFTLGHIQVLNCSSLVRTCISTIQKPQN